MSTNPSYYPRPGKSGSYKYHAFLSYSQAEDNQLAPALQNALQKLNMPWHRLGKRSLNIFRDGTNLGTQTGNLTKSIQEGIEASEKFILLCSPTASRSFYVNLEVAYFQKLCIERNTSITNNLILIVTEGDIKWDNSNNCWDWEHTNILPLNLRNAFGHEPLWIDFREIKKYNQIEKSPLFKSKIISIAAPLLGKEPAEIDSKELREKKKQTLFYQSAAVVLMFLLGVSIFQTIIAKHQTEIANEQTEKAEKQTILALKAEEAERIARIKADSLTETEAVARKEAELRTAEAKAAAEAEEIARKLAEQKTIDERTARLAETEARNLAEEKTNEALIAAKAEEDARKSTDSLNEVLESENTALTSLYLNDVNEKTKKATEAYLLFYKKYNKKDPRHLAKRPIIYKALYEAYFQKFPESIYKNRDFQIEKLDIKGQPLGIYNPLDTRPVYHLSYVPEIDLSIYSLANNEVLFGNSQPYNVSSVTAADFIKSGSWLFTGHDDGNVMQWKYDEQKGIKTIGTAIASLEDKIIWLSSGINNSIFAATRHSLYNFLKNEDGSFRKEIIGKFDQEKVPSCLFYSNKDSLLFIGYQNGDLQMHTMSKDHINLNNGKTIYYDRENYATDSRGKIRIYLPVEFINYNAELDVLSFSLTSGTFILYKIHFQEAPLNHYEMVRIEYQEPVKDAFISDHGIINVALNDRIYRWPIDNEKLYQETSATTLKAESK